MKKASLATIAKKMKNLDFCMLITQDGRNVYHSRPMSNNGKVEYDGNAWFFTYEKSNKVKHIKANPKVTLIYQDGKMLFIECYGKAYISKDKSTMDSLWVKDLNRWFPKGIDTPGICLVKVVAKRVQFWDKEEDGEYKS